MTYKFEDFLPSPPQKPEPLPATEKEILEKQIADLREQVEVYRREIQHASYSDWFSRHISQLCEEAAKRFREAVREQLEAAVRSPIEAMVEKVVAETFEREGQELGQVIYQAVLNRIQPYAIKPR